MIELTEGKGSKSNQDETMKSGVDLKDDQSSHLKDAGANKRCATDITPKSTKNRKAEHLIQPGTKVVGTVEDYPKGSNNRGFKSNKLRSELPMESIDNSIDIVAGLKQSSAILRDFFQVAAGFFLGLLIYPTTRDTICTGTLMLGAVNDISYASLPYIFLLGK